MSELGQLHVETLRFITAYLAEHGRAPVMREIAEAIGVATTATAWRLVQDLQEHGLVRTGKGKPRAISLPEPAGAAA